jgi:hypothetical protein
MAMADEAFAVAGTGTKSMKTARLPSKAELETALGLAHADAHILAELECARSPDGHKSQYVRTIRVGPTSGMDKTLNFQVEDEFKCLKKGREGDGHQSKLGAKANE